MKSKKGAAPQSATASIASLILLIALFLILYLILLPKGAREDVLKGKEIDFSEFDNGENGIDNNNGDNATEVLLLREPGVVLPPGKEEIKKNFASISFMDTTQKVSRKLADRVIVSSSIFSDNPQELSFEIKEDDLQDLNLYFNVIEQKGDLIIMLNGMTIFQGIVSVADMPIKLPVEDLQKLNKLAFSVKSPGWAFLSSNQVTIRDVELVKESSVTNKQELRKFEVSRAEAVNDATVEFFVNCIEVNVDQGILKVFLNRRNVFFGKIVCDASQASFDISEDYFSDGTNYLTFEIDKGNYIIEQIRLKYKFNERFNPQYFFTVDDEQIDKIRDGDAKVKLKMKFDNSNDRKRADIRVNSGTVYLDQQASKFDKDITKYIEEGENFIKIFAKDEFNIVLLEIDYIE